MVILDFADEDVDSHVVFDYETLERGVPFFSHVVTDDYGVVGKLFEEAFGCVGFEVEVEGGCGAGGEEEGDEKE